MKHPALKRYENNPVLHYKKVPYDSGLVLLDLKQPWKVIGLMRKPLLSPEAKYELEGFRGSVLFPGGICCLAE